MMMHKVFAVNVKKNGSVERITFDTYEDAKRMANFLETYVGMTGNNDQISKIIITQECVLKNFKEAVDLGAINISKGLLCKFSPVSGYTVESGLTAFDENIRPTINVIEYKPPERYCGIRRLIILYTIPMNIDMVDDLRGCIAKAGEYLIDLFNKQLGKNW